MKKYLFPISLAALAIILFQSSNVTIIIAGIAIFLIGMIFMEEGFKLFSGGILERVLQNTTNTLPKAIGTGIISTSIVQSSSLITVIIISFLSAELITLSGAIGVVFGSNIGTTTTAWIVSSFGVKIKIAAYAMPMIIFGVVFKLSKSRSYQGFGNILIGLGFVFLGIEYMKDGFDSMREKLDLAKFAIEGYLGVLVYVLLGAVATIIIQSSSATMALIITALASNQIVYINALELAIGANIGTTVTAIIGALTSNENGKRLAVAHFVFNAVTAFFAIILIYQFQALVDYLGEMIGIGEDYTMKLALFHTIFNFFGVLLVAPFTNYLVRFLEPLFISEKEDEVKAKYLNPVVVKIPDAAIKAIKNEVVNLYDNALKLISNALYIEKEICDGTTCSSDVRFSEPTEKIDVESYYAKNLKSLYSEIIYFSTLAQENMSESEKNYTYDYKLASRDIVEAIKDLKELNKNLYLYLKSKNSHIKEEYNTLRLMLANIIVELERLRFESDDIEALSNVHILKHRLKELDNIKNDKIDSLIRQNYIDSKMATSLINDSNYVHDIAKRLIEASTILWIEDRDIQNLGIES